MNNYEYIISGLPVLTKDYKYAEGNNFDEVVGGIRRELTSSDNALVELLLEGLSGDNLTPEFYAKALGSSDRFIREYFHFDLKLRNAKVRHINSVLSRPEDTDIVSLGKEDLSEFEEASKVAFMLNQSDIVSREKGLDRIIWDKVDSLTIFDYFDIDAVLAYILKLHIVDRWLSLDEHIGRELFRKLVNEVRGTFKGVEYNGNQ